MLNAPIQWSDIPQAVRTLLGIVTLTAGAVAGWLNLSQRVDAKADRAVVDTNKG